MADAGVGVAFIARTGAHKEGVRSRIRLWVAFGDNLKAVSERLLAKLHDLSAIRRTVYCSPASNFGEGQGRRPETPPAPQPFPAKTLFLRTQRARRASYRPSCLCEYRSNNSSGGD